MANRRTSVQIAGLLILGLLLRLPVAAATSSFPRLRSLYVPMRDGVRIAVDVWLPGGLGLDQRIPALMTATRYWRAQDRIRREPELDSNFRTAQIFNDAGYALVLVDARGTGASFGSRAYEMTADEVADYGEIADWIVAQPWSNGKIGSYGVSYVGNAAEMLLVARRPAVAAAAPLFNDFNYLDHLAYPGGLFLDFYTDMWGRMIEAMDADDICALAGASGEKCGELKTKVRGVKPVDDDPDRVILTEAVAQHRANVRVAAAARGLEFRDDPFGPSGIRDLSRLANPSGHVREIAALRTPLFIRVGWLDAATVEGALARFRTLPNPQDVVIGPWSHGGLSDTDPFCPPDQAVRPSLEVQRAEMIRFFDERLKPAAPPRPISRIRYYTMGAGTWTDTEVWPPPGFQATALYFGPQGTLTTRAPADGQDGDSYTVDYSATTGAANRWHTNIGGGDVVYPDRAAEDRKLLVYTGPALERDMEITGHPLVTLYASSDATDGAFFAYLEDVDEAGRVTYITEGEIRAVCRKVSHGQPPYVIFGPYRTFERRDAEGMAPGKIVDLTFDLWATSALVRKGHRIRIAVAGADKDNFAEYPAGRAKAPTIRVERDRRHPSKIVLPLKAR
jgi:hypothetical protein